MDERERAERRICSTPTGLRVDEGPAWQGDGGCTQIWAWIGLPDYFLSPTPTFIPLLFISSFLPFYLFPIFLAFLRFFTGKGLTPDPAILHRFVMEETPLVGDVRAMVRARARCARPRVEQQLALVSRLVYVWMLPIAVAIALLTNAVRYIVLPAHSGTWLEMFFTLQVWVSRFSVFSHMTRPPPTGTNDAINQERGETSEIQCANELVSARECVLRFRGGRMRATG